MLIVAAIATSRTGQRASSTLAGLVFDEEAEFAPIVYFDDELEKLDKQRDKLTEKVSTQRDKSKKSEFTETISDFEALPPSWTTRAIR